MTIDETLLEVYSHKGHGFMPLVRFGGWRVAVLRYLDSLMPENIETMERHEETDEVFVLLEGRCILFIGEGDDESVAKIHAEEMKPLTIYNVKQDCWHTHALSQDAALLIVENRETSDRNSREIQLDPALRDKLVEYARVLWAGA